jgi:hypothetical protein
LGHDGGKKEGQMVAMYKDIGRMRSEALRQPSRSTPADFVSAQRACELAEKLAEEAYALDQMELATKLANETKSLQADLKTVLFSLEGLEQQRRQRQIAHDRLQAHYDETSALCSHLPDVPVHWEPPAVMDVAERARLRIRRYGEVLPLETLVGAIAAYEAAVATYLDEASMACEGKHRVVARAQKLRAELERHKKKLILCSLDEVTTARLRAYVVRTKRPRWLDAHRSVTPIRRES